MANNLATSLGDKRQAAIAAHARTKLIDKCRYLTPMVAERLAMYPLDRAGIVGLLVSDLHPRAPYRRRHDRLA